MFPLTRFFEWVPIFDPATDVLGWPRGFAKQIGVNASQAVWERKPEIVEVWIWNPKDRKPDPCPWLLWGFLFRCFSSYGGLVVEIQPLDCYLFDIFLSPSNVNRVGVPWSKKTGNPLLGFHVGMVIHLERILNHNDSYKNHDHRSGSSGTSGFIRAIIIGPI